MSHEATVVVRSLWTNDGSMTMALLSSASHFPTAVGLPPVGTTKLVSFLEMIGQRPAYLKAIVHAGRYPGNPSPRAKSFGSDQGLCLDWEVGMVLASRNK